LQRSLTSACREPTGLATKRRGRLRLEATMPDLPETLAALLARCRADDDEPRDVPPAQDRASLSDAPGRNGDLRSTETSYRRQCHGHHACRVVIEFTAENGGGPSTRFKNGGGGR
jgi:hypothetical protein